MIDNNTEVASVCPEHDHGEHQGEDGGGGEGGGGAPEVPLVTQRGVAQTQGVPLNYVILGSFVVMRHVKLTTTSLSSDLWPTLTQPERE